MRALLVGITVLINLLATAQVYIEKKTRHRFAQLNMGLDLQTNAAGTSSYLDEGGNLQAMTLISLYKPRFIIGGTHFWGHADFYIAIPLSTPQFQKQHQLLTYSSGVETVFTYYPFRIEDKKIRPYIGFALASFRYKQSNLSIEFGEGPEINYVSMPVLAGFTFNYRNHLFELGVLWNYKNKQAYSISRNNVQQVITPPVYLNLSYRIMLETTLSAEKDWQSGKTEAITKQRAEKGKLNNFYFGIGISSAFWLGTSSYNKDLRPYIQDYGNSLLLDVGCGYYLHQPDISLGLSYRAYTNSTNTYGANQTLKRKSFGAEFTKFLFDYHGFVPFVGPIVSVEKLSFHETFENAETQNLSKIKPACGLIFGWDIRPNRIQTWILRTNLRRYPKLELSLENGKAVSFANLEFNFIQLVVYPGRAFMN